MLGEKWKENAPYFHRHVGSRPSQPPCCQVLLPFSCRFFIFMLPRNIWRHCGKCAQHFVSTFFRPREEASNTHGTYVANTFQILLNGSSKSLDVHFLISFTFPLEAVCFSELDMKNLRHNRKFLTPLYKLNSDSCDSPLKSSERQSINITIRKTTLQL